jgi:hypothetical protein
MTEWSFRSVLAILVFSIVGAARSAEFTPPRLPDGLLDCILPDEGLCAEPVRTSGIRIDDSLYNIFAGGN